MPDRVAREIMHANRSGSFERESIKFSDRNQFSLRYDKEDGHFNQTLRSSRYSHQLYKSKKNEIVPPINLSKMLQETNNFEHLKRKIKNN